ncbi:hypothetical protein ASC72_08305 [Flavobacterium sp. Root420]|nr:hypothetical protein ASC72_08305 [Flavobacterium sp. Root420]
MIVKKKNTAKNNSNSFVNRYKKNGANWRHFAVVTLMTIYKSFMNDLKKLAYFQLNHKIIAFVFC